MPAKPRQVLAFSGVLNRPPGARRDPALVEHAVRLAGGDGRKRVCFIPTATGDSPAAIDAITEVFAGRADVEFTVLTLFTQPSVPDVRAHLTAQDVLLVGGGSVVNLMAVWRAHGLAPVIRECWEAGVVLAGWSAGSLCWHRGGPTDSFGDSLAVFADGLGLLPYSNGVHDSLDDQPRRRVYREYVASGRLPAGWATEDGVGLHYIGTELHEAVAMVDGARAWRVEPAPGGGYRDMPITPRRLPLFMRYTWIIHGLCIGLPHFVTNTTVLCKLRARLSQMTGPVPKEQINASSAGSWLYVM